MCAREKGREKGGGGGERARERVSEREIARERDGEKNWGFSRFCFSFLLQQLSERKEETVVSRRPEAGTFAVRESAGGSAPFRGAFVYGGGERLWVR